ncbi:MAG: GAF domain-containing protein [Anaerolineae bacterium]|nr:GAF domain-containing protein [Anaerolineae bacterium]
MSTSTESKELLEDALNTMGKLLEFPVEGIGWTKQNGIFQFLGTVGAYFASDEVEDALRSHLPQVVLSAERSCILPMDAVGLTGEASFLLLLADKAPDIVRSTHIITGLLLKLPAGIVLTEVQWQSLTSIANLTMTSLYGLHALQESRRQQVRIQASAKVGRDATILLDPDELLNRVVHLISEQFGFYHVGIFLVDDSGKYAVLRATNSVHGRELIAHRHRLKIGEQGMVGYVISTGLARIALDVELDTTHFVNPFLPDTRSEITLPMRYGDQIIGAIDVQSVEEGSFTTDDLATLQIMADQLTNALLNARLHEEIWQRMNETRLLREVMLHAVGNQQQPSVFTRDDVFLKVLELLKTQLAFSYQAFFVRHDDELVPTTGSCWPATRLSIPNTPWELVWEGQLFWRTAGIVLLWAGEDIHTLAAIPVQNRETSLAIFAVADSEQRVIEAGDLHFLEALSAQLSTLLQNAEYYEAMARGAALRRRLLQIGEQMTAAREATAILDILTHNLLSEMQGTVEVGIFLDEGNVQWVKKAASEDLAEKVFLADSWKDSDFEAWRQHLTERRMIMPERHEQLKALSPEMCALIERLPKRPALLQPLKTPERTLGFLFITLETFDEVTLTEQITWLQAVANQAALALDNAQLLYRLRTQARHLQRAYDEARHLNDIRTQMIQNVSHELRTPLNLILGYTQMLTAGAVGTLNEQQQHILEVVYNRSKHLNRLIQNLTSIQGRIHLKQITPVDLVALIAQVVQEFQAFAQRQGVQFYIEMPPDMMPIPGDQERLHLVFTHLVENAIKFSPEGGNVFLQAEIRDDWAIIKIADQGIGIAAKHLSHVFERFYQVDGSTTRRFGGMGIGLALVWDIVEAHGGNVQVTSAEGEGSTFIVFLPCTTSPKT